MDTPEFALFGISQRERETMKALLRMPPNQQSAAKASSKKGDAQRRRREAERQVKAATVGD